MNIPEIKCPVDDIKILFERGFKSGKIFLGQREKYKHFSYHVFICYYVDVFGWPQRKDEVMQFETESEAHLIYESFCKFAKDMAEGHLWKGASAKELTV